MSEQHERIEELLAVRALEGLEPGELAEYDRIREEHGIDCEICLRAEIEFDEVAGRLAFMLGPVSVPEGMEDALMARALEVRPAGETVEPAPENGEGPAVDDLERRRRERAGRRPNRVWRTVVAVAAAVALVAAGFAGGILSSGGGGTEQAALARYLAQPGVQLVRFEATGGGELAVAYRPGDSQSYVFGRDLSDVPEGKQYELWLFPPDNGPPAPGPTFDPADSVIVSVPADASKSVLMAVTVEKEGGVDAPTRQPVFTAPISTA
jgi:anti-sigma-K factor RskA